LNLLFPHRKINASGVARSLLHVGSPHFGESIMRTLPRCSVLVALLCFSTLSLAADKVLGPGENADTGSRAVRVPAGVAVGIIDTSSGDVELDGGAVAGNIDTGSGSIELGAGASAGRIDTGSGDVRIRADAQVADIDTGSGSVRLGDGARTEEIDTGSGNVRGAERVVVDGRIDTGSGAVSLGAGSTVRGDIDTGSGSVELVGSKVGGKIDTGSGDIRLLDSEVSDDLATSAGNVELMGNSRINGDLLIRKSSCWGFCWGDDKATRVTIGASASVLGDIRIERETELWVHENAQIGRVTGAQVKRFAGERP